MHVLDHPALAEAVEALAKQERGAGQWKLARGLSPFSALEGRGFPVVLSFLSNTTPAPSTLEPARVAERLAKVFQS